MIIIGTLFDAIVFVINALASVYFFIVLGACLVSWVNADPYNPIVRILRMLTEPLLWRIRKIMPFVYRSGLDFSPVVLLIAIQVLRILLSGLFRQLQALIGA
ncbi:YggT family protein [Desulfovibrio sp. OttesenSCG-928-A18]|nr:YggT family protein [Desulfovibrio sp. OttesenSCG-928-A18]